ncbi:MAG: phosphate ABC transporter substrate-binding protein PstS family protein [Pirellulales bacterium]|nr:phosphate ABC transporter substrate-binding protein PstS family protein [Pirellulales bacterium]
MIRTTVVSVMATLLLLSGGIVALAGHGGTASSQPGSIEHVHGQVQKAAGLHGTPTDDPQERILLRGSTSVAPIVRAFKEAFTKKHPDVLITMEATDSDDGAKSLIDKQCDVACMSRPMNNQEYNAAVANDVHPVFHMIAIDGIAVIVNPDNPVSALSKDQLHAIFCGNITNWSQVRGRDQQIVVIQRAPNSGTRKMFAKMVMDGLSPGPCEQIESNSAVQQRVAETPAAIGYVDWGFLDGVKPLAIDGVKPIQETVAREQYPLSRPLYLVTDGYPPFGSHLYHFVTMYKRPDGRQALTAAGYVPTEEFAEPAARDVIHGFWPWILMSFSVFLALMFFTIRVWQLNRRLTRSETKYRTLYDSGSDSVLLLDGGVISDCNDSAVQMGGCKDKSELIGKTPVDVSPEKQACGTDTAVLAPQYIAMALQEGGARFEWMCKRLNTGEPYPTEVLVTPMVLDGRPILQLVVRDITKRKQNELTLIQTQELATQEAAKLRSMIEGMDEGIVVANAIDVVTDVNEWFLQKCGLRRGDIQGRSLWVVYPDAEGATQLRKVVEGFRKGESRDAVVMNRELFNMQTVLRLQPIYEDDQYQGIVFNIVDVTDFVEARLAAEASNRAKSEFLANMSHELRTPMTAILGFTDILVEGVTDREQLDAATTIKQNGEYLLGIVNDILDLSRIEAGKVTVERIPCSPCRILTQVASLMRVRAEAQGLPLEIAYEGMIPLSIQSDPVRLRQVLVNLVGNAIKFTEVGKVRLAARLLDAQSDQPKMQFEIIDTGIGMSEQQIAKLFKPFSQADASATRKHGGAGLGLMISKRLAEKLGGDITVKSAPGKGSTFTVTIDAGSLEGIRLLESPDDVDLPREEREEGDTASESRLDCRVLLAEDGPDNQRLIAFVLRKAGADVTLAENGKIALDLALESQEKGQPFDVILMDMQMPVMDGYTATGKLRQAGYTAPIIALTAHAMKNDRAKCLEAGCDDYMTKPVERNKLIALVAKFAAKEVSEPACGAS